MGSDCLIEGLPDVVCLLDNPVHKDLTNDNPFDPYMLDGTERSLSELANIYWPDSLGP